MPAQTLSFGLLLLPGFQWLDAAGPVDYISNHAQDMITPLRLPQSTIDKAPIITWHHISSDLAPVRATSGPPQLPTCTYADCPPLDYLIVPGTDPSGRLTEGCSEFLQTRFKELKGLLLVCTGSLLVARTGTLDGLNVCSNKITLKMFAEAGILNKKVKWVGDRRWTVDGKVWSSAGATSGIDLAAEFARVHFDPELVEMMKQVLEYEPKPDQPDVFAKITEGISLS